MRVRMEKILSEAYGSYGVCAFNIFNAEQLHGVFRGARKAGSPVIIQLTPVAREYMQPLMLAGMIRAAESLYPEVTFSVHLDHGNETHSLEAIETGEYSSVMIDASYEVFDENVRITKKIVKKAHEKGIWIEAELGVLSGVEGHLSVDNSDALYTDPLRVEEFVRRTSCDSLAVAIGTSHGAYKFSGSSELRLDILTEIQCRLPGYPLVLHGASSVPYDEIVRINNAGGRLKENAKGINEKDLLQAIALGVCKINIATDFRLIWSRVCREFFLEHPDRIDPVIPGRIYMDALENFVADKCRMFQRKELVVTN
jgi:fructose-bisphosphate aldolase class II